MEKDNANNIYLDFSKIFDTVSHYHFLVKKKNFGISKKKESKYCKIFLRDGTMKVKIDDNYSET